MRAELALAVTTLIASPAFAGSEEWPDGPNKEFFADCNGQMHRLGPPNSSARVAVPAMSLKPNSKYFRPIAVTRKTLGSRGSTKDGSRSHRKRSCQTLRLMGRPIYSCCTSGTKLIGRHPAMTW